MNKRDEKLRPYLEAIPEIMKYQIVTKAVLASEVLQEIRERSDLRRIIDKIRELIS